MLSTPSTLSQEPPTRDLVDWANLTLAVAAAELFVVSLALFVAAAWSDGSRLHQLGRTGGIVLGLSIFCLFAAAVLDQAGDETA